MRDVSAVSGSRRGGRSLAAAALLLALGACVTPRSEQAREYLLRDAFYDVTRALPAEPGRLVRSQRLSNRILPIGSQAWRIMYTTTFGDGRPGVAVATVLAPTVRRDGPRPVITWAHGTVGLVQKCMPSLVREPFAGIPALDQVVAEGWVVVATDYATDGPEGPHPYVIGEGEARSALDATRAARQLTELALDERTVVWGHSQGGHAALWAGMVGPSYAPDVKIVGVVPIAPATDMGRSVSMRGLDQRAISLGSYMAVTYSHFYPDVEIDQVVRADAIDVTRRQASECHDPSSVARTAGLVQLLGAPPVMDWESGAFGRRLDENIPSERISAPMVIAQGLDDDVVFAVVTDDYVSARCATGQEMEYWTFVGSNHDSIVRPGSPLGDEIVRWTRDRFAGRPSVPDCRRIAFPVP